MNSKNPCHILLIEDDQDDIDLLCLAFNESKVHFQIDILMRGDLVAPWLNESKKIPNVIVMDLNLPKVHGRDVLKHIKGHKLYSNVPVVVLTTSSAKEDKEYCMSHGAEEYFTKPSTIEHFYQLVQSIFDIVNRSQGNSDISRPC